MKKEVKIAAGKLLAPLTSDQVAELRKLAAAIKVADEAKKIRERFKAFLDDNEVALRNGVTANGLRLSVRISKQLQVEEI